VPRVVVASSNAVVGPVDGPVSEETVARPISPYGASKLAAESYVGAYHGAFGLTATALRFANVYGPYSLHKSSVVPAFMRAIALGRPLTIHGTGQQTRDYVHVDDLVTLILSAVDAPAERVGGHVFQVGTGVETSVLRLAEELFAVTGRRVTIAHGAARPGEVARSVSNIGKARDVLGYAPRTSMADGLASTWRWFEAAMADPRLAAMVPSGSGSD
jgi:UDP-glucose 4-epimerase